MTLKTGITVNLGPKKLAVKRTPCPNVEDDQVRPALVAISIELATIYDWEWRPTALLSGDHVLLTQTAKTWLFRKG